MSILNFFFTIHETIYCVNTLESPRQAILIDDTIYSLIEKSRKKNQIYIKYSFL